MDVRAWLLFLCVTFALGCEDAIFVKLDGVSPEGRVLVSLCRERRVQRTIELGRTEDLFGIRSPGPGPALLRADVVDARGCVIARAEQRVDGPGAAVIGLRLSPREP